MPHDIVLEGARQILTVWDDSEHLSEVIQTIETSLQSGSDQAVDAAKCLVEAVCKTILTERGVEFEKTDSPSRLIRKATQTLGISENDGGDSLQGLVRSMVSATESLMTLRNDFGPLAHGRDAQHTKLGDWHRLMAVRTAETIAVLLFEVHESRTVNLKFTRRAFDDDAPENQRIDDAAIVEFDEDTHEVVLNELLRFRPSQILYTLDREAYVELATEVGSSEDDSDADEPSTT